MPRYLPPHPRYLPPQVLRDLHITRLTDSNKLDQHLEKLKGSASQKLQKKALAVRSLRSPSYHPLPSYLQRRRSSL